MTLTVVAIFVAKPGCEQRLDPRSDQTETSMVEPGAAVWVADEDAL
jgi:hypothetical protein